jgi:hypothetical protein
MNSSTHRAEPFNANHPYSPFHQLAHIPPPGQELPSDPPLDDASFLLSLPLEAGLSCQILSQAGQHLLSILSTQRESALLRLNGASPGEVEKVIVYFQQLGLNIHVLRDHDPQWIPAFD